MKKWRALLGVQWEVDNKHEKKGSFRTTSHLLARDKWSTIGRGKSTVIQDDEGQLWGMKCVMLVHDKDFEVMINLKKW